MLLQTEIDNALKGAESKIWHGSPVWFLASNPIVGYGKLKAGIQLLFWSGQSFKVPDLIHVGKDKAAGLVYTSPLQVNKDDLRKWLSLAKRIQWNYKDIVKNKGVLERLSHWNK